MSGPNICYYVSGHGFGHATRASQVVGALIQASDQCTVTICTQAPRHLFPQSPQVSYRRRTVDSAIVQPLPYEIDVPATFGALQDFVGSDRGDAWIREESTFVLGADFNLILADAPWLVGRLRAHCDTPLVLISNFTFDLIFGKLLTHLPSSTSHRSLLEYEKSVEVITASYKSFDHLITLPGSIDFPFLSSGPCDTAVSRGPLIYRPAVRTRRETLRSLNIPTEQEACKILLIQFGGHLVAATGGEGPVVPDLPDGWICLSSTPLRDPRFHSFPLNTYLPDLVDVADMVLGKIGYGTVSECVGMGKPLLYVAREMFAEEPYLLAYMGREGNCLELSRGDFERGAWRDGIARLQKQASDRPNPGKEEGSLKLAGSVLKLIQ